MTYLSYPGTAGFNNFGQIGALGGELGGFWSSVKKVGKVVATPITLAAKTTTAPLKAVGVPYADTLDKYVNKVTPKIVSNAVDTVTNYATDASCKLLMNKYFAVGAAAVIAVYTAGAGLVIAQGAQVVATGMCARRMAEQIKAGAAPNAAPGSKAYLDSLKALEAQTTADATGVTPGGSRTYPNGSIAFRQTDGLYRVAVPKGLGDVNGPSHIEVAIVAAPPAGTTEVDKSTYSKATAPFYLRTSFLVGAGVVTLLAIGGAAVVIKRRRRA